MQGFLPFLMPFHGPEAWFAFLSLLLKLFVVMSRNLPYPMPQRFTPISSSKSFVCLALTFESSLVNGVRLGLASSLTPVYYLFKGDSFPTDQSWCSRQEAANCR